MNYIDNITQPKDVAMNYVLFALAIMCLIGIGVFTMAGIGYAEGEWGLHPAIVSFAVAVLSIVGYKACSMVCED